MPKINTGRINEEGNYEKIVSFSKAVLWMAKQLSVPKNILDSLVVNKVPKMLFIDRKKGETWEFHTEQVVNYGREKQVGQEPQIYFPIELAKIIKHKKDEDNTMPSVQEEVQTETKCS